ncbi:hypothetical protein IAR55_006620 [Kwoniella newhampshirensis]|uniref:Dihydrolipoamide acetyltransferase component of pyruvate dehydrogenase complex n=1 Tax=Kwoniella newhampshirensis TaxID=1651941 RepID=A0AAW0YHY0_9TREE
MRCSLTPFRLLHSGLSRSRGPTHLGPISSIKHLRRPLPFHPHPSNILLPSFRSVHATSIRSAPTVSPFKLHDIGEGITEVEVLKWYVAEGQEVQEFDALCEVQSDKSVVELTSHKSGVVKSIKAESGTMVKVGQVLCEIRTSDGDDDDGAVLSQDEEVRGVGEASEQVLSAGSAGKHEEVVESPKVTRAGRMTEELEEEEGKNHDTFTIGQDQPLESEDSSHLLRSKDEYMDLSGPSRLTGEAAIIPAPPTINRPSLSAIVEERRSSRSGPDKQPRSIVRASPAVRTLAAKLGVDLSDVEGTGEGRRVTKDDIERAALHDSSKDTVGLGQNTRGKREEQGQVTRVEFGRTRKVMWRMLGEQAKIPHFGYSHTLNLTPLLPYLKASTPSTPRLPKPGHIAADIPPELIRVPTDDVKSMKTGLLTFLVKAMILALEEHPIMRSRVKESGDDRWLEISKDGIIGIAVSDPQFGLLTPSLSALPPSTSLSTITSHLKALRQAPTKPTWPAHLTISSVGGLGEATGAMPVIPPGGGLAICAVGRAKWEMEWATCGTSVFDLNDDEVKKQGTKAVLRAPVGWSADHRVLEGEELIAFTETWKRYIEEPWTWIRLEG